MLLKISRNDGTHLKFQLELFLPFLNCSHHFYIPLFLVLRNILDIEVRCWSYLLDVPCMEMEVMIESICIIIGLTCISAMSLLFAASICGRKLVNFDSTAVHE